MTWYSVSLLMLKIIHFTAMSDALHKRQVLLIPYFLITLKQGRAINGLFVCNSKNISNLL